ncbi:(2Fe-2S)-binding protein [Roseibium sediminicola]|uniref:(2Fe-2S)-binding protein n=1 Tax=Roseibium sediminicola TaxID=2933272 RepID=A0ABT0GX92_9HYPH|nr:(2Fe-2S)-binding protein [Roseibium sp. CAU 1639]
MKPASPFRELQKGGGRVRVTFDGRTFDLREGGNLAAELLAAGIRSFRKTPVSGAERGPFCMMGACFDCLVVIDGVTRQACMCEVSAGLVIDRPGAEGEGDA